MEMKPEYNHGMIEYYHLELHGRNINKGFINAYKALKALRKLGHYSNYSFWKFWSDLRTRRQWAFFQGLYTFDEAEYHHYLNVLTAAGTSPEACHRTVYFIVPNDKPSSNEPEIDNEYLEKFYRFSMLMNGFGEYSLEKWAIANHVQQAYRLSVFASSPVAAFSPSIPNIIRIWKGDNGIQYETKQWVAANFCEWKPPQQTSGQAHIEAWQNLQEHMLAEFWTDKEWSEYPGPDSVTYFFEGYRAGQYKIAKSLVSPNNLTAFSWGFSNKSELQGALAPPLHARDLFRYSIGKKDIKRNSE